METLRVNNVSKQFTGHRALHNVSISVPRGSIFGLLGPNGAGKTTLIRIINRITAPDEGEILLNGRSLGSDEVMKIGYLPEERGLYKKMKVGEQAIYLAQLKGLSKHEAIERLKVWFKKFEITTWWDKKVEELSKGMQQKVQFMVTVLHKPDLLIFDEPFTGFDPINVNLLKDEILKLRDEGATIIFSTHNMASVEELCDYIALINQSEKILDGNVDEIRRSFKQKIFEITFPTSAISFAEMLPDGYQLVEEISQNGMTIARIKIPVEDSPNILLNYAIKNVEVHGFSEILPSMNDIFISTVNEFKK
ncbi:MAG: ATP-binding cassette domain-containing protein [Bacteroidales bacterium]|jgi:ABC-2 type transport system ATP-binding protein|nr:ATP-binding cassette domain-containing protein [Bacteroidales bacterium]MDI9593584.1 ATP-binding cassette domain-containing protein [Bacteroidota bacterium]MBP7873315.1 ATP-binding cassette domain-containing protein [Bacteroidales bacterium]MCO6469136.1 ATP-binding cassette domain-containing protein [Bacteroidales bacterium]MCZ2283199.1 ATP-binding cassette domain-containing protein [Bacteroidales bacterium]